VDREGRCDRQDVLTAVLSYRFDRRRRIALGGALLLSAVVGRSYEERHMQKVSVSWKDSGGEHSEDIFVKDLTLLETASVDEELYRHGYMVLADPKTGEQNHMPNRTAQTHHTAAVVASCVCDAEGKAIYTKDQVLGWASQKSNAYERVVKNIIQPTVEEAAKNSTATPAVASS
jgi:hypothetical protein